MRAWLLVLGLGAAHGDASAPDRGRVNFAGHVIDLRAAKILRTGPGRCPDESTFPCSLARREDQRFHHVGETQIVQLTRRHALYASFWRSRRAQGLVLDVDSQHLVAAFEDEPAALIEDAAGELLGLVVVDERAGEVRRLGPLGQPRWQRRVKGLRGDRARAFLDGSRLYVAPFGAISHRRAALRLRLGERRAALERRRARDPGRPQRVPARPAALAGRRQPHARRRGVGGLHAAAVRSGQRHP